MTRAPQIKNYDISRTLQRLGSNWHAQIEITVGRRLLKSAGRDADRQ